ncbi:MULTISPECIES: NAD(P)H-dependent oxidoreductase [unclassified Enterococcus]|jgi:glutathione-regulated potassium-efflux system ancillary protein KefG|uniref:NAD(P)H-dependent oxidoreductase n=1 Tax=unclassified Enterococcus TaxID=2608891 RepID=UPI003D2785DB
MKTLLIVSHPAIDTSLNQQFFKEASADLPVTWHHLESIYPDYAIDSEKELALLSEHQRIIFQFPFYWYSSPAHLKLWQDTVLSRAGNALEGKELGIVLTTGVAEKEYQAGGKEEYTISEFLRPFQRIAGKFKMTYLEPFVLAQFMYLTKEERYKKLVNYQQYITLSGKKSLLNRIEWFKEQLNNQKRSSKNEQMIDYLLMGLEEGKEQIEELDFLLKEVKGEEG